MEGDAHLLPEEGDRDILQIHIGMAEKLVSVRIDAGDRVSVDRELYKTVFKVAVKQHVIRVIGISLDGFLTLQSAHVALREHGVVCLRGFRVQPVSLDALHPVIFIILFGKLREKIDIGAVELHKYGIVNDRKLCGDEVVCTGRDILDAGDRFTLEERVFLTVEIEADVVLLVYVAAVLHSVTAPVVRNQDDRTHVFPVERLLLTGNLDGKIDVAVKIEGSLGRELHRA